MKFQGDASAIPIMDVVQNLEANRKSGILTIRRGQEVRRLPFSDGAIISYDDNAGFSVLEWFRQKDIIPPDIFKKAERRYRRAKKKTFGEIVASLGGIELDAYLAHVKSIVLEMLYETLSFRKGHFEFEESEVDPYEFDREVAASKIRIPVRSVLMEAARRMDTWEAIRRSLPSQNDIYRVTPSDLQALEKEYHDNPIGMSVADLMDGTRSIREVIATAPVGRFTASQVVADLVSRKVARPVDGDELVQQVESGSASEDSSRTLVRLKAALEREPGNQGLLLKVAELSLAVGQKDEAAVYYKLLAQSLVEQGRLDEAKIKLRRSLELNGRDIGTWQKLYDVTEQEGDLDPLLDIGLEMVEHLRALGLNELARDHLVRMLKTFPDEFSLKLEHADTLFALGERSDAVKRLLDLAREMFQAGQSEDAERALLKVIEYDPKHRRAREIYDKVRTGKLTKQRKRRRLLVRTVALSFVVATLGLYIGYDYFARMEFSKATREVFAEGLGGDEDYMRAKKKLEAVVERHSLSLLRFFEARETLRAIDERLGNTSPRSR